MSRGANQQGGVGQRNSTSLIEHLRVMSSDAPEDVEFRRDLMKLHPTDRRIVRRIVERILEIEAHEGSDAAEATLEQLIRALTAQSGRVSA